jgi:N-acetylneuraminic acid mutarotase
MAMALLLPFSTEASELRWVPRATVPQMPKEGFTVTEFNGRLWMVGGFGNNSNSTSPNQILYSDDGLNWIVPDGAFPFLERKDHAALVFNDYLYVVGGRNANDALAGDIWRSPNGLAWERVDADPEVAARFDHAAAVHGGAIWVTGGTNASGIMRKDTWVSYNGSTWMATLADFPIGRSGHRMASYEGDLWVVGGNLPGLSGPMTTGEVWKSPRNGGNWTVESSGLDFNVHTQGLIPTNEGLWGFGSSIRDGEGGVHGGVWTAVRHGADARRFVPTLTADYRRFYNAELAP